MAGSTVKKLHQKRLKVGDRVSFRLAGRKISGTIVEDRGRIGSGSRRLFAVRAKIGRLDVAVVEIPAEELSGSSTAA